MLGLLCLPFLLLILGSALTDLTGSAALGMFLLILLIVGVCASSGGNK